eukprot:4305696-Amphidinium_carterae.1
MADFIDDACCRLHIHSIPAATSILMIALYASVIPMMVGYIGISMPLASLWLAQSCVFSGIFTCDEYHLVGVPASLTGNEYYLVGDFVGQDCNVFPLSFFEE